MITQAIEEVVTLLASSVDCPVTDDPGAFYPDPVGVLVGVPTLADRTLAGAIVSLPVHVVCSAPLDAGLRDRLFSVALVVADCLGVSEFRTSGWAGGVNAADLPAYLITATLQIEETNS